MKAKNLFKLLSFIAIIAIISVSCSKEDVLSGKLNPIPTKTIQALPEGDVLSVNLMAGQSIHSGTVSVSFNSEYLFVNYVTTNGWMLDEVHLWVGSSLSQMPKAGNGNPKIGLFPYKAEDLNLTTDYGFVIPLSSFGGYDAVCESTFYVAAHAVVKKSNNNGGFVSETAWGQGPRITNKGSWAMYFGFIFNCEEEPIS